MLVSGVDVVSGMGVSQAIVAGQSLAHITKHTQPIIARLSSLASDSSQNIECGSFSRLTTFRGSYFTAVYNPRARLAAGSNPAGIYLIQTQTQIALRDSG